MWRDTSSKIARWTHTCVCPTCVEWETLQCDFIRVNRAAELTHSYWSSLIYRKRAARFEIDRPWNNFGNSTASRVPFLHLHAVAVIWYLSLCLFEAYTAVKFSFSRKTIFSSSNCSSCPLSPAEKACFNFPTTMSNHISWARWAKKRKRCTSVFKADQGNVKYQMKPISINVP